MRPDEVQVLGNKIKDLLIPEPPGRLEMDFLGRWLEEQQVAAIFQGGHVGVKRLPGVAHQRHPTGGSELSRDTAALQGRGIALPEQRFRPFRLTEGLEQANAATVGIQTVDVIQDDWLMPVLVSLE